MGDRWLYTVNGAPAYYQQGKYIYSAETHTCDYFVDNNWIFTMKGEPSYFIDKNWVFTPQGQPAYFYG